MAGCSERCRCRCVCGYEPDQGGRLQQDKGKHKRYSSRISRPRQERRRIPRSDSELTRYSGAELCSRYLARQAPGRVESDGIQAGGGRGLTPRLFPINLKAIQRRPIQRASCVCPDSPIGSLPKNSSCKHATRVTRSIRPETSLSKKARPTRRGTQARARNDLAPCPPIIGVNPNRTGLTRNAPLPVAMTRKKLFAELQTSAAMKKVIPIITPAARSREHN